MAQYVKIKRPLGQRITEYFANLGKSVKDFFVRIGMSFVRLWKDFKEGDWRIKLSFLVMGLAHMLNGQVVKGITYLGVEILFVLFMVFFGGTYMGHLFSGQIGTKVTQEDIWNEEKGVYETQFGDNSMLILLYIVVTLAVIAFFVIIWRGNITSARQLYARRELGMKCNTFIDDVKEYGNGKFHKTLLIPPLAGIIVFTVLPIIFMILIAFTNYNYEHEPPRWLFTWDASAWARLFTVGSGTMGGTFLNVFVWTIIWAFFATFTNYFGGMILALIINKKGIRLKKLWRTCFVVAIAVPQFVTLLLMSKILDVDGILNVVLGTKIDWLGSLSNRALIPRIVIIVVNMWIGIPYTILMCSGILMNIPADLYEAATVDGAGPVTRFFKITLPYMFYVTGPSLITTFVGNINNFNIIWLLTNGGPGDNLHYTDKAQSTDLLVTWLYRLTTGDNPQYNVASVIGIVIFVITATLSLIVYKHSSATKSEGDFS